MLRSPELCVTPSEFPSSYSDALLCTDLEDESRLLPDLSEPFSHRGRCKLSD